MIQEVAQGLRTGRVAQLGHGLGLDLTDAFTGHAIHTADVVQRLRLAVFKAIAHLDDARPHAEKGFQHLLELFLQQGEGHGVGAERWRRYPQ